MFLNAFRYSVSSGVFPALMRKERQTSKEPATSSREIACRLGQHSGCCSLDTLSSESCPLPGGKQPSRSMANARALKSGSPHSAALTSSLPASSCPYLHHITPQRNT